MDMTWCLFDNSNLQLDSSFAKNSEGVTWIYAYGIGAGLIYESQFLSNRLAPAYGGVRIIYSNLLMKRLYIVKVITSLIG